MRTSQTSGSITAQAIAGTYVVLFGMSIDGPVPDDFLGFSIERSDRSTGERAFLDNFVLFSQNDRGAESETLPGRSPPTCRAHQRRKSACFLADRPYERIRCPVQRSSSRQALRALSCGCVTRSRHPHRPVTPPYGHPRDRRQA